LRVRAECISGARLRSTLVFITTANLWVTGKAWLALAIETTVLVDTVRVGWTRSFLSITFVDVIACFTVTLDVFVACPSVRG
jgi:hypothetical protein